jgi:hypothetical protein
MLGHAPSSRAVLALGLAMHNFDQIHDLDQTEIDIFASILACKSSA